MELVDFLTRWNANILALANVVLAIGTIVLAVGIPYAIRSASKEEKDSFYATLDDAYFELKKLVIEHPHLASPDPAAKTPDQIVQYDAYALMVWNFIETICDYSRNRRNWRKHGDASFAMRRVCTRPVQRPGKS